MFHFELPVTGNKLASQLNTMGIHDTTTTLTIDEILSKISEQKLEGPAFMTQYFCTKEITAYGKIIEKLLMHNLLSLKTILEEFGIAKCDELFQKLKSKLENWPISAADKIFDYPNASRILFKHCLLVRH